MPFTFAHPAVVLPLYQRYKNKFSLTGLVVGSLVPDFEYFITMTGKREWGHSLAGLFWFDLPVGIFIAFSYHYLLRDALIRHLPRPLQQRVTFYQHFEWNSFFRKHFWMVIISVFIGSASHLFLDSFTNEHGFFATRIPLLQRYVQTPYTALSFKSILSYLLSLGGIIFLCYAFLRLPKKSVSVHLPIWFYWLAMVMLACAGSWLKIEWLQNSRMKLYWYLYLPGYAIIFMAAGLAALVIVSAVDKLLFQKKKN